MSAIPGSTFVDPQQLIADLQRQIAERTTERDEALAERNEAHVERDKALAQQAASAEVLQVINSSSGNLAPVFDAILREALHLCDAAFGMLLTYDGDAWETVAMREVPPAYAEFIGGRHKPSSGTTGGRIVNGESCIHITDVADDDLYRKGDPHRSKLVDLAGARTFLTVALRKEDTLLGGFGIYRREVRPFSDKQIALLQNFAAQAVIAMENARLLTETREALEQQTATAEVLQVINSSPGDLAPVFDAMLERAMRLCGAAFGALWTWDGEQALPVSLRGVAPAMADFFTKPFRPRPGGWVHNLVDGAPFVHIPDILLDEAYRIGKPALRAVVELGNFHSLLMVPLRKEGVFIGGITIYGQEARPFSKKQIALLQNFAAQAVIAMENARLITETREALEQQTATAEVLQVINSSPGDLAPVFNTMLEKAMRLCEAPAGYVRRYEGGRQILAASHGLPEKVARYLEETTEGSGTDTDPRLFIEPYVHIVNLKDTKAYQKSALRRTLVDLGGVRTGLAVPLRKDGELIGSFRLGRYEVRPFSEKQIALVQNFAAQAVIAIENARLLNELRDRTRDLQESLEYQTAISDVLKVISQSTFDLQPVLDTVTQTAARLCNADLAMIFQRVNGTYQLMTNLGFTDDVTEFNRNGLKLTRGHITGRTLLEKRIIHIEDIYTDPEYVYAEIVKASKVRTVLGVPLLREGEPIGVLTLGRQRVDAFTERQIGLVRTFADQAVIAIENTRLLNEIRQRQAELRVTFDNMGDGVAMFDAQHRLVAWNSNFQQMLDLPDDILEARLSFAEYFDYLAKRGEYGSTDLEAWLRHGIEETGRELRFERTRPDGRIVEVRKNAVPGGGFVLIYSDVTERKRSEAEIRAARDAAETALRNLQAAQASLVQAQKMAALGQLTAGIAHEIKNPLNFVNNFAELSIELLGELKESAAPGVAMLDDDTRAEIDEVAEMLTSNLDKIAEHGKRADNIVKSMLEHSRGVSGERREVDLNALIDEALNLAYHGARAQDQSFNIALERDFQPGLAPIEVAPQEMTRVFLNLFSNGFYAATKRQREGNDPQFKPSLKVTTREAGDAIEITVRDNGTGIPPEIRDRLFQPFFTTKPTGEGTGLGLSITYDIITQQHGGTITVDSEPGAYTVFTIHLPRRAAAGGGA